MINKVVKNIGDYCRKTRERNGLTQKEVAKDLNVSSSEIGKVEKNKVYYQSKVALAYAKYCELDIEITDEALNNFKECIKSYLTKYNVPLVTFSRNAGIKENVIRKMILGEKVPESYYVELSKCINISQDDLVRMGIYSNYILVEENSKKYKVENKIIQCDMVDDKKFHELTPGNKLKKLRELKGMTQEDLARSLSIPPVVIARAEKDEVYYQSCVFTEISTYFRVDYRVKEEALINLANKVKEKRKSIGLDVLDLANYADVEIVKILKIEKGEEVHEENYFKVCNILGIKEENLKKLNIFINYNLCKKNWLKSK